MRKKIQHSWAKLSRFRRRRVRRLKVVSRHPYAVPVITFAVLLAATIGVVVFASRTNSLQVTPDSKIVIISHDHEQQVVPSHEPTVGALLKKLNITLNQGDVVEPAKSTRINQDEFRINIYRAVPVEIVDGAQVKYTFSAATTPRAIAEQSGATVYPADDVTTTPDENFLKNGAIGEQVVINRAMPINLNLYGTPLVIRTHAATVGDLIKQENIHLAATDQVIPAPDTPLTPNEQVFIVRNGTKIESVAQAIPMPVQTIQDSGLAYGTSAVRQQGSAGQEVLTYQDALQNGVVTGRTLIQTVVTQQPVTEIVVEGTSLSGIKGDMALAGISASDYQYVDYIVSHESGWCPTKWQGETGYCPPTFEATHSLSGGYGYGLGQSTPPDNMAAYGSDWETNPITQLRWANAYALSHYGSWAAAYDHWYDHHWW